MDIIRLNDSSGIVSYYIWHEIMPFKKTATGKYKSPSWRTYTKKQVKAYYATNGFKRKPLSSKKKK